MQIESHTLNDLHALRYQPEEQTPEYALVISHGLGAEIWSYDAPDHGRSKSKLLREKLAAQ